MSAAIRYSMVIQWSSEDESFLVSLPEWEGRVFNPVTHGGTYGEAAERGFEVLEGLVASAVAHAEPLPEPSELQALAPLA